MQDYPTVTIGCPVRNREKYLPHYLKCIHNLDYPKNKITLYFIVNDSQDKTSEILWKFKNEFGKEYNRIKIDTVNQNAIADIRMEKVRKEIYKTLSNLRNSWLQGIKTDYALSCDSDIMMPSDTLQKLIRHEKDYVAGLIINGYLFNPDNPYLYTNILKRINQAQYLHITEYEELQLIEVDFTGAIMLLSYNACKAGKFATHNQGEDGAFCEDLKSKGFKIYCDTSAKCTHCMSEEFLKKYIEGTFVW